MSKDWSRLTTLSNNAWANNPKQFKNNIPKQATTLILDISPRILEKVLYFASYIVLEVGESDLQYKQVLTEKEFQEAREQFGNKFRVGMGAETVKELLQHIDLEKESEDLKRELKE